MPCRLSLSSVGQIAGLDHQPFFFTVVRPCPAPSPTPPPPPRLAVLKAHGIFRAAARRGGGGQPHRQGRSCTEGDLRPRGAPGPGPTRAGFGFGRPHWSGEMFFGARQARVALHFFFAQVPWPCLGFAALATSLCGVSITRVCPL